MTTLTELPITMNQRANGSTIPTGRLVVNLDTRVVSVDDQPVHLTGKEYGILELLSLRKGTTLTKECSSTISMAEWTSHISLVLPDATASCRRSAGRRRGAEYPPGQ